MADAIRRNDAIQMLQVIANYGDLSAPLNNGDPPAVFAARVSAPSLKILLSSGADPNGSTRFGRTPLIAAVGADDAVLSTRMLIEAGANPNQADNAGTTALMAAAGKGALECVRLLVDAGADPNQVDCMLVNALYRIEGPYAHLQTLPQRQRAVAELLVAAGAVHTPWGAGLLALKRKDDAAFRTALDAGIPLRIKDQTGRSMLHWACICKAGSELVRDLLRRGADVNAGFARADVVGRRPLHEAAFAGTPENVQMLLDFGAHIDCVDETGATPLDAALDAFLRTRSTTTARLLVTIGTTSDRMLALAIQENSIGKVNRIIADEIDIEARRQWLGRPDANVLDWVAEVGGVDIAKALLTAGWPVTRGAVIAAKSRGDTEMIQLFDAVKR